MIFLEISVAFSKTQAIIEYVTSVFMKEFRAIGTPLHLPVKGSS